MNNNKDWDLVLKECDKHKSAIVHDAGNILSFSYDRKRIDFMCFDDFIIINYVKDFSMHSFKVKDLKLIYFSDDLSTFGFNGNFEII